MNQRVASRALVVVMLSFAGTACSGGDEADGNHKHPDPPVTPDGVCVNETGGETYSAGMTFEGDNGITVALADSKPAPPVYGDNTWTIEITDAAGAPVVGATVVVSPIMVKHGHGPGTDPVVTEIGGGTYRIAPLDFTMPGLWNTKITVTAGSVTDDVQVGFCVE